MDSTRLNIAFVLLQLTAMCTCQKFSPVYRGPITADRQIAVGQQQYANDAALQSATAGDVYQQYPGQQYNYPTQQYYYPAQQKQALEKQQQTRLEQQRLQLQQLQQLQSSWGYYQPAAASPQQQQQYGSDYQQQYGSDYQQQLQLLQQQQQQQPQQQQSQQQQYYQTVEKPLFRPATIPVNETPAEGPQQQKPNGLYQQQNAGASANQQLPQNPLGVYYSSAADVSKFQFSGNGVNYSY